MGYKAGRNRNIAEDKTMKRTRQNGFTLVEIMISMALLVVTVLAVMGVIANNASLNNMAREREIAINEAALQVERIFMDAPQNVDSWDGDSYEIKEIAFSDGQPARVTTTVTPAGGDADLRLVTVNVIWNEAEVPVELQVLRRSI